MTRFRLETIRARKNILGYWRKRTRSRKILKTLKNLKIREKLKKERKHSMCTLMEQIRKESENKENRRY